MSRISIPRLGFTRSAVLVTAGLLAVGCASPGSSPSTPTSGGSGSSGTSRGVAGADPGFSGTSSASPGTTTSGTPGTGSGSAGSSQGSGGGTGADNPMFPTAVGDTWTYEATMLGKRGTLTSTITAATADSGGQKVFFTSVAHIIGLPVVPVTLPYQFNSDGSIAVPYSAVSDTVSVKSGGIVWPPQALLRTSRPQTSVLALRVKSGKHILSARAKVTVKGAGVQTVIVPAGTFRAMQIEEIIFARGGVNEDLIVRTWLVQGIGPVESTALTKVNHDWLILYNEQLSSLTKS